MSYPVSYFTADGDPIVEAAGSEQVFEAATQARLARVQTRGGTSTGIEDASSYGSLALKWAIALLHKHGFVVTLAEPTLPGVVSRIQVDAFAESAADVERTLYDYAARCDAASERDSVAYGRCVIERELTEPEAQTFAWKGRLVLHPSIGRTDDPGLEVASA